jgi:hypothetical protein
MRRKVRKRFISINTLLKLLLKNIFSIFYFMIVGLVLAVIYTQFLVKPSFIASGAIENIGGVSETIMPSITLVVTEQETLEKVVNKMNIPNASQAEEIEKIRSGINVGNYSAKTLKVNVSYSGSSKEETEIVLNYVIDSTIERFVELNPDTNGKLRKQQNLIVAKAVGVPNSLIYVGFILVGGIFGSIVGVYGDLIKRRVLFETDFNEYSIPYNTIDLDLKKDDDTLPPNETEAFSNGTLVLLDKIEGTVKEKKVSVIGVVNLGYETYDALGALLAEQLAKTGLKILVIDLDLEYPILKDLYNLDGKHSVTNLITTGEVEPHKINENLDVLPSTSYMFPARFLKDERLNKLIRTQQTKYDYVFLNVPRIDYYASLLFNFDLLDLLLINTSFEGTKIKTIDNYISNINPKNRSKLFLNGIDSRVKKKLLPQLPVNVSVDESEKEQNDSVE